MPVYVGLISLSLLLACQSTQNSTDNQPIAQVICRTLPTDKAWYTSGQKAPLFNGLGNLHFPITTRRKDAQRYFDQGLMLAGGFNHAEAARSFYEAIRLDSTCAMAYWGFSYVLGPNYNAGMESDNYDRAYAAIQQALKYAARGTDKEKALIAALAKRYPARPVVDRRPYDVAYSQAMKQVHERFQADADVAALYAESVMDLHPWDLWEKDGRPKPWTPEIVAILENLLTRYPDHSTLHHLYIHAVEASSTPERGLKSAAILSEVAPGSSHLVHMPSHIYIRTGKYHEGSVSNQKAVAVDSAYLIGCYAQGIFPLSYFPHNYHLLAATATLEGNRKWAMRSARKMAEYTKKSLMADSGWSMLQHYYTIPYHVALKFTDWNEVLELSKADTVRLPYPTAIRHYARGLALLGNQQTAQAKAELRQFERVMADPGIATLTTGGINPMSAILAIAERVLRGEILGAEGKLMPAIVLLREAVALEDKLNYNEPPDWFFSVRHNLGAMLLKAKRYPEAEAVYGADLNIFPRNAWALAGLHKAQVSQHLMAKAQQTQTLLAQASVWADRDIKTKLLSGL